MKTYELEVTMKEIYTIVVEAKSESEAADYAFAALESNEGKAKYHQDSDAEITTIELD